MSLTVSFNPTSISDEEREVLQRLVAKPGTQRTRVFEGTAADFLKVDLSAGTTPLSKVTLTDVTPVPSSLATTPDPFGTPVGPSIATLVQSGALPAADNPATGATSPAEAFGLATPETTPAAAFSAPVVTLPAIVTETGIPVSDVAPVININTPVATPSGVELDAEGLPWDSRIHSSSREKIKNGTWKIKRGTGETFIIQVKNELRAALGAPAAHVATSLQAAPALTVPNAAPDGAWPFPTPNAAPVAQPASTGPTTLPEFMKLVGARISSGTTSEADVHAACAKHGVGFHTLANRPDLIPSVWSSLNG